jgi:hypothetical protein
MPSFSAISKERLSTCHPDLQRLFNDVITARDCSILVGFRCEADQDLACKEGNSETPWPTSKHNCQPSRAVDVAPYPVNWGDIDGFREFASFVKERAAALNIGIRWGGDWSSLADLDHFELTGVTS